MGRDDASPDGNDALSLGELTQRVHVDVPHAGAYVLRGPAHTLVINRDRQTPEERILEADRDE